MTSSCSLNTVCIIKEFRCYDSEAKIEESEKPAAAGS